MKKKLFLLFLMGIFTGSFAQFTEGFENGIPPNWTIINNGEPTTWSHISTTVANTEPFWIHSGTGAAGISVLWGTQDDYLITPAITVVAGVNDRISFWCSRFNVDLEESMEVMISTTTPDAEGMAIIDEIAPEAGGFYEPRYKKYYYDLSGYVGQTIYMGFRATHTQAWKLFIDDFTNDALPTTIPGCSTITYPENGALDVDTVGLLKWTEVPGIEGYAVALGITPGGSEIFGNLDVSDVTTKAIGPLELGTTYYVKIIPYNATGPAVGCTEYSFTTRSEILGDFCDTAIDLSTLPSPFTSTTTGAGDDDFACYLWTGPDIFYKIEVPNGSTLSIRQTHNNYESANTVFYGHCSDRTEIYCGIATDFYNPVIWKNTTGSSQLVYWIQYGAGWNEDQNDGEFTIEWSLTSCDFPTATYQTVSNCEATPGFFVNVDVTSMGSAEILNITDNQGSLMQTTTETGIVQFGPYTIGTPIMFTIVNADEASCFINSNPITLAVCPLNCSEATVITADEEISCIIEAGSGAWNFVEGLSAGKEKMYSFTPTITGKYAVETQWDGETIDELPINPISLFYKIADTECDSGWSYISTSDFFSSHISSEDLTAGTEYLLLFDGMETMGSYNKFKIVYYETCENAVITHTVISDCEEGSEYYVDVNIMSLGTATSHNLWISTIEGPVLYDVITETGIIHLGPYPYGSEMSYSLTNDQTQLCTSVYSGRITQLEACPNFYPTCTNLTYPANNATDVPLTNSNGLAELTITWDASTDYITPLGYSIYVGFSPTTLSYIGYTTSEYEISLIGFTANTTYYWKIVPWNTFEQYLLGNPLSCEVYSFTTGDFIPNGYCLNGNLGLQEVFTPSCSGSPEVITPYAFAGYYDYVNVIEGNTYTFSSNGTNPSGAPDLVTIGSENGTIPLAWGNSPLTWTANITGTIRFYLHLSELCQGQELYRIKSVACGDLSTPVLNISELKTYPNPVKNILNITNIDGIKDVTVLNILGQTVISKTVNGSETKIDMQNLSSGTYLVKINSTANETKTVKIIKE